MESELFGHSRGAFTGAYEAKRGLVQEAHGGTAFFDEIGDMPKNLQVKLLRVLQEREYRPLGALAPVKVDIRVISATHRNLAEEVREGRFREDLYHRLNVVCISLPPLRERSEDILPLAEQFLIQFGGDHEIAPDALEAMHGHDWPGNVRELKNCVEHMIALSNGRLLRRGDLPASIGMPSRPVRAFAAVAAVRRGAAVLKALPTLREIERAAIFDAVAQTNGVLALAAATLGIGRTTLYRKMKEYSSGVDISPSESDLTVVVSAPCTSPVIAGPAPVSDNSSRTQNTGETVNSDNANSGGSSAPDLG
jgi:DNA-binding NtrC family response regulator